MWPGQALCNRSVFLVLCAKDEAFPYNPAEMECRRLYLSSINVGKGNIIFFIAYDKFVHCLHLACGNFYAQYGHSV